jgi:hypothetical protein
MPSGLTCNIYNGTDMSLRGFALNCVRQLGAGYHATNQGEKEMPLDKAPVISVSDWHPKQLAKAKEEVKHWINVENNPDELDRLYNEYLKKRGQDERNYNASKTDLKARYLTMKAKVEAWNLPEKYSSLKELMLEQLDKSTEYDCMLYPLYDSPVPSKEEWLKTMLSCACRDVEYHTKEYKKEVKRVKEYNNYLQGLYNELDKIDPLKEAFLDATEDKQ